MILSQRTVDVFVGLNKNDIYFKNLKIFQWKIRRFRLRWDSHPGLSIAGQLL